VGFNKRKMEDQRRQAAEKEAATRRATDTQVLEDAERLIAAWNERQAKRMPMLFSPTIGAAITAGYWFLWVRCPACRTTNAIDLRTLDRQGGGEHGDLLGAPDHPSDKTPDPTAAKVLSRGEALAAPAGRADDFSWPRPDAGASTTLDIAPTASNPAPPQKKVDEAKKPADVGKDNKAGKESAGSKTRRSSNADLDGARASPAPVGSR
jgi:hypothetical protein